jgi:hypothetical protein
MLVPLRTNNSECLLLLTCPSATKTIQNSRKVHEGYSTEGRQSEQQNESLPCTRKASPVAHFASLAWRFRHSPANTRGGIRAMVSTASCSFSRSSYFGCWWAFSCFQLSGRHRARCSDSFSKGRAGGSTTALMDCCLRNPRVCCGLLRVLLHTDLHTSLVPVWGRESPDSGSSPASILTPYSGHYPSSVRPKLMHVLAWA